MSTWLFLLGVVVGAAFGVAAYWWWQWRRIREFGPDLMPANVPHTVDLLRRAHGAMAACVIVPDTDPVVSVGSPRPAGTVIERALATTRLALTDGREHVLREGEAIVAAGDGQLGAAVVLPAGSEAARTPERVTADLRRLIAELRVSLRREFGALKDPAAVPDWIAAGSESLEGTAFALAEAVSAQTGRATAVVLRDPGLEICTVLAVSRAADRRLLGLITAPDSAVGRACTGDIPVVGPSAHELWGRPRSERRRRSEEGTAFPLRDGQRGVGALVVFGPHATLPASVREWVMWMAVDAGPRLASAAQVRAAETRAVTDELTRLPNRRALERLIGSVGEGSGALCLVDIDLFKQVNDGFGHAAGDATLRHVARLFRRVLREDDFAARLGGEEFALWLPQTPLDRAVEVAERVREAVETSTLHWGGADLKLTCSIGVSSVPETVRQPSNLVASADAALYRAKELGRNRVEVARVSSSSSAG